MPLSNSDGTISFPSQNPYTDRRPGEPRMPKGMEWSMLSKDERERLRGLSKEHAENIGLHILAAYALESDDPQAALQHAQWVARQASRIDFARETLAFVAYRQGDYSLALREFRTAHRMNGYPDYLPFIADCERGLGHPRKAIDVAVSDDGRALDGEAKVEMFLVYAGAMADLKLWDKAVEVVRKLERVRGLSGEYRMRATQAEQLFLEEAGRTEEASALDDVLDKLESQYADADEDDEDAEEIVIDYDLERLPPELFDEAGIDLGDDGDGADGRDARDGRDDSEDDSASADDIDAADDIDTADAADTADTADAADDIDAAVEVADDSESENAAIETSDGETSDGETSDGETSDGETSDGETSGDETSGDDTSGDVTPASEVPGNMDDAPSAPDAAGSDPDGSDAGAADASGDSDGSGVDAVVADADASGDDVASDDDERRSDGSEEAR
ncbi:hypothetical protein BMIN_0433 [Bifidobacterium minimum]|uniref:Helicase n=1 Tax=Bifidobacterium minimum TaxID=1693 RepID=A0A087BND7_9BIFI|nr:hypothetical protein BMIN_0433 [Bifidobacterium minimum]